MNRYPLLLALLVFALISALLTLQENPELKDKGIRVENTGEKTALGGTLQQATPHHLTAITPLSKEGDPEPVSQSAVAEIRSLFDLLGKPPKPAAQHPEEPVTSAVLNRTPIRVNWKALRDIRESGSGILEIDSGSGQLSAQVAEIIDNPGGGYSLSGDIAGDPLGTFLATIHEDALVASITTRKGLPGHFAIAMNADGIHELQEIDPTQAPVCGGALQAPPGIGADKFRPGEDASKGNPGNAPRGHRRKDNHQTIVDVMILYTEAARNDRGGENATIAAANQAINWTNQAFINSGVDLAFRLVHTHEVDYSESGNYNTDLDRLRDPSDGYMDGIHLLRDTYAADIVSMRFRGQGWGGVAGLGFLGNGNDKTTGFNVCKISTGIVHKTFAHECGHNMGCGHHRVQNSPGPGIFDYAAGWRWTGNSGTQWRSIMAYHPGERVAYFSNPNITYDSVVTGTATDYNARTLRETKSLVAGFREEDTLAVNPTFHSISAGGGNATFNVSSNTNWSWSDSADWLTSNESTTQSGNQTFSYFVAPNTSAQARVATITITTGNITRTHTLTQEGAPATLAISPTSRSIGGGGGNFTFNVTSNTTWGWSKNASWLTSNEPITQDGNQEFSYSLEPNTTLESRTTTITITTDNITRTHIVSQSAPLVIQVGQDINGEDWTDESGRSVSLSADGNRVAIGAHTNDGNGSDAGHVRIYGLSGNSWVQLGQDIDGEAAGDFSGYRVSLSADGNRVAIGARYNDGNGTYAGHVRVYQLQILVMLAIGNSQNGTI